MTMKKRTACAIVAIAAGSTTHTALAQEILFGRTATFSFGPVGTALDQLGLEYTGVVTFEDFLDELRSQEWDLVIVRGKNPFSAALQDEILTELEAHVARGGKLHFQMSRLDEVTSPRYYELLGLEGAVDVEWPLEDIFVPTPPHPVWDTDTGGFIPPSNEPFGSDYGDDLILDPASFAVAFSGVDGPVAMAISADGLVIVNGQEWDNWPGAQSIVRRQISWLLSCKADLDGDGDLTVFDFLEFQNLFDAGDVRADVFYDGRFDIFDFLAFFNQFQGGC